MIPCIFALFFLSVCSASSYGMERPEEESPSCVPTEKADMSPALVPIHFQNLPQDSEARKDKLNQAFPEHLPTLIEQEGQWLVRLERPHARYGCYLFDRTLSVGLGWWGKGTEVHHIPFEKRLYPKGLLAIEDQWMAYAWSLCFKRLGSIPQEIVLIHLDDHRDMMSPIIHQLPDGSFADSLTGKSFHMGDPSSVEASILSGSLGKASILTPLIWTIPKVHIRHLCLRPHLHECCQVETFQIPDSLLSPDGHRIDLKLTPGNRQDVLKGSNYIVSPDPADLLADIPEHLPVLLHADMDFFNNRMDGDSLWLEDKTGRHDPDLKAQKTLMDNFFAQMDRFKLSSRVIDVCIGISAGFYPGEFWEPMVTALIEGAQKRSMV